MKIISIILFIILAAIKPNSGYAQSGPAVVDEDSYYDLVLSGGRVLDPETGLDGIRNIGIRGNRIAAVSTEELHSAHIIDASGLIVSPGFIDVHQHGQEAEDYQLKAFDGVTSGLEMEIGRSDVEKFLRERAAGALINYGTTASFDAARGRAFNIDVGESLIPAVGPATDNPTTPAQMAQITMRLEHEIRAGALGVGIGLQYVPGSSHEDIFNIFRLAVAKSVPIYIHPRSSGHNDPGSSIESVNEVIGYAASTGASVHIAHINSTCLKDSAVCLEMIAGARARGLDVSTEAYPYTVSATYIGSAFFNPGWQGKMGIGYGDLAVPETGERLTKERFDVLHADTKQHIILMYVNTDKIVDADILNPIVMIASDGVRGHPREAGTYCRILARYVRDQKSLTLTDAIRKMSLMPAKLLESSTPDGARKGRIQVGADADIVAFDLATVHDAATYSNPSIPSVGMKYVIVQGIPVISGGLLLPEVLPGKPILGRNTRISYVSKD